ncbi:MAG: hypothetical protein JXN61_12355 [Sedimentisphaerales bacterium]|nr:hypothetical protein [Sedimentisphaerales bacterium]
MAEKSTFGLKREQLAELFSLALGDEDIVGNGSDDQTIAELLRDQFSAQLPKGSFPSDSLLLTMGRMGFDVASLGGKSLRDVLLDRQCDMDILLAVKDCAKKLTRASASEAKKAIATTIYYAAIAGALLYYDKKITGYSYGELGKSLDKLIDKKWMTPELAEMLSQARAICRNRQEDK